MNRLTIGLVGNPNCGKTTLFNALTGSKQRVGNWSGVTVEKKTGIFKFHNRDIKVVDLPGTYNLNMISDEISIDEKIACDYILSQRSDIIINIIDAANLERNLYLTTQLLEMGAQKVIIALNMVDVAQQRGIKIDAETLSEQLNCPVVVLEAHKNKGINELKAEVLKLSQHTTDKPLKRNNLPNYPEVIVTAQKILAKKIQQTHPSLSEQANCLALRLLEDDFYAKEKLRENADNELTNEPTDDELASELSNQQKLIADELGDDADIFIADSRYSFVNKLKQLSINNADESGAKPKRNITAMLDKIVLNRILGIPIFLLVMYCMFVFSINIGGVFQNFVDISSDTIFVQGLSHLLNNLHVSPWITAIIASGIGKGINTTITFAPIIGAMFLFLSFLEDSGYMTRAAFVMDRLMRALGLPGKSFVPLIVGFGCNVPAIMSARTLENKRDRILTVMMSPFMACGARLAIFAVFTAAFFPHGGQNIVFALYLIGILVAILTGLILRKTVLQGDPSPMIMELPPYHLPTFKMVLQHAWNRLKNFLWKAGRLIIPICILIGALNAITIQGNLSFADASTQSLLSFFGKHLTPLFAPMGIHTDNWPATVGLLTGILAKEVVVATLNTLYTQVGHLANAAQHFDFWAGIHAALQTIPDNLRNLSSAFSNPILASAPEHSVRQGVFGLMYQRFNGQIGAFAYLLFVVLYIPCISSTAVMARELGRYWTMFSIFWNTCLAYGVAVMFYQLATFKQHPMASVSWVIGILITYGLIFLGLKIYAEKDNKKGNKAVIAGVNANAIK